MFNINGWEIVILGILFLVVFGPERIPEAAAQLGRLVADFRRMTDAATADIRREIEAASEEARKAEAELKDAQRGVSEAVAGAVEAGTGASEPVEGDAADPTVSDAESGMERIRRDAE